MRLSMLFIFGGMDDFKFLPEVELIEHGTDDSRGRGRGKGHSDSLALDKVDGMIYSLFRRRLEKDSFHDFLNDAVFNLSVRDVFPGVARVPVVNHRINPQTHRLKTHLM